MNHNIEDDDTQPSTDYANWKPAEQVRATYRAARQAAPPIERKPLKNIPAPEPPKLVSLEQRRLNEQAEELRCPKGFGDPRARTSYHWVPAVGSTCVRCGAEARTILDDANSLEPVT